MRDLLDTAVGIGTAALYMWLYQQSPILVIGFMGFHIGVVSCRMGRNYFVVANH
jgi:hypothetical protein